MADLTMTLRVQWDVAAKATIEETLAARLTGGFLWKLDENSPLPAMLTGVPWVTATGSQPNRECKRSI